MVFLQEIWLKLVGSEDEEVSRAAVEMYQAALECITRMRDMLCCEHLGLQTMAQRFGAGYGHARALHIPSTGALPPVAIVPHVSKEQTLNVRAYFSGITYTTPLPCVHAHFRLCLWTLQKSCHKGGTGG